MTSCESGFITNQRRKVREVPSKNYPNDIKLNEVVITLTASCSFPPLLVNSFWYSMKINAVSSGSREKCERSLLLSAQKRKLWWFHAQDGAKLRDGTNTDSNVIVANEFIIIFSPIPHQKMIFYTVITGDLILGCYFKSQCLIIMTLDLAVVYK